MKQKTFLGNGWNYPPIFQENKDVTEMVADEENIRQSLWILLSTSPGERVHRYDYGCPLRKYNFELMDTTTQTLLKEEIMKAIILFEPRVEIIGVRFDLLQKEGVLQIHLDYTIRRTNRRTNMVYPFYLNEGTDLFI